MPTPYCVTEKPFNLTPTGFDIVGRITDDGGLPCSLYINPKPWWMMKESYHRIGTNLRTGDTVQTHHTAYWNTRRITMNHGVINPDDDTDSEPIKFFLPRERYPTQAPPWLVLSIDGVCSLGYYLFQCTTDTACHLTAHWSHIAPDSVAKPHVKRGVTTWHDMYIAFHTSRSTEQMEARDTITHTFKIPFAQNGKLYYWYLLGTIDGMESISVSPLFSASCNPPGEPTIINFQPPTPLCWNYSSPFDWVWGSPTARAKSSNPGIAKAEYYRVRYGPTFIAWQIYRGWVIFPNNLPVGTKIKHAWLHLRPSYILHDPVDGTVCFQLMNQPYPNIPIELSDYDHTHFGKTIAWTRLSDLTAGQWADIDILPGCLDAIVPQQPTKLGVRIGLDVSAIDYQTTQFESHWIANFYANMTNSISIRVLTE